VVRELKAKEYTRKLYLLMENSPGNKLNGVIKEKETNKVVGECIDSLYENIDVKELNEILKPKGQDTQEDGLNQYESEPLSHHIEMAEDGTLIRLYNYENEWHTATSKCIDAEYSYWLSDNYSFDKMFKDALEIDYTELNPRMTYNFILKHPLNRLVLKHNKASLVFVCKINNETGEEHLQLDSEIGLVEKVERLTVLPKVLESSYKVTENWADSIDDFEETRNVILEMHTRENIDWTEYELEQILRTYSGKGLVFVKYNFDTKRYTRILYETEFYKELKEIKGNTPNVDKRWLELYKEKEYEKLEKFRKVYPEYNEKFEKLEERLKNLVTEIYSVYLNTHVFRKYQIDDTNNLFKSVKRLHGVYMRSKTEENKRGEPITYEKTLSMVLGFDIHILMKLLEIEQRPNKERKMRILKRDESPPLPSIE
jgi:hypothetical protein